MHRTIISAALLITSAVVSLTGCVSVPPPAGPEADGEPQIVQAPAREALERLMRSRSASAPARRPTHAKSAAPHSRTAPHRVAPHVPLPRLPAVRQPPPVELPAQQQPRADPRQRETCTVRRDFDQWQSGGNGMSLC